MLTGLNSSTATHLQLGAGVILKTAYTNASSITASNILTATNGGITFSATPTFFVPSVDGMFENIKGAGKAITNWDVTLSFTAVEASAGVLLKALGCADQDGTTGAITARHTISSTDYADLYVVAEKGDGSVIQITIKNALSTGGLSLQTANNGNGGISFTIKGHYDISALDTPPFEIKNIVASTPAVETSNVQ